MANFDFVVGRQADKDAGRCQIIGPDLLDMRQKAQGQANATPLPPLPAGSTVNLTYLEGVIAGHDAILPVRDITAILKPMAGEVFLDGSGPKSSPSLPEGHWGGKGCIMYDNATVIAHPGITIQNWKDNFVTPYNTGSRGGITKLGPGNLWFMGKIRNCDQGLKLTDNSPGVVLLKYADIDGCGSGDGQSHNIYSHNTLLMAINSKSRNCRVGHNAKLMDGCDIVWGGDYSDDDGIEKDASYAGENNGGDAYWLGVYLRQGQNDSNPSTLMSFNTYRNGQGPHRLVVSGCTGIADIAYEGVGLKVNNDARDPVPDYDKTPTVDFHAVDGFIGDNLWRYRPSKLNYAAKGWVKLPDNDRILIRRGTDRLLAVGADAIAPQINWDEVKRFDIGQMLAELDPDKIELADAIRIAEAVELKRAAFVWPPGVPPQPAYVPAVLMAAPPIAPAPATIEPSPAEPALDPVLQPEPIPEPAPMPSPPTPQETIAMLEDKVAALTAASEALQAQAQADIAAANARADEAVAARQAAEGAYQALAGDVTDLKSRLSTIATEVAKLAADYGIAISAAA